MDTKITDKPKNAKEAKWFEQTISRRTLFWTIAGAVVAIVALVWAIILPAIEHVHNDLRNETKAEVSDQLKPLDEKLQRLSSRLEKMDGELEFIAPLIREKITSNLSNIAKQPVKQLQANLPELQRTIHAARLENVRADSAVLKELTDKLVEAHSADPVYWRTTADFLAYRSENSFPKVAEKIATSRASLSRCTDHRPKDPVVLEVPSPNKFTARPAVYEDCRVQLDDPQDVARLNAIIADIFPGVMFSRCLIEYHGGPIDIYLFSDKQKPDRKVSTLYFEECIFDFSSSGTPSPEAQKILLDLLLNTSGEFALAPGAHLVPRP